MKVIRTLIEAAQILSVSILITLTVCSLMKIADAQITTALGLIVAACSSTVAMTLLADRWSR